MARHISVSVFLVTLFASIFGSVYAWAETEKFSPLDSSLELGIVGGKVVLETHSGAVFSDSLVEASVWAKMTDEEKKGGYSNIYYYRYTFRNAGTIKIRFTFANYDALRSPLFRFNQDFSIVLEPGQTKTINFTANTTPKVVEAGLVIMAWYPDKDRWFFIGGGGSGLYIPQWNAIVEESAY